MYRIDSPGSANGNWQPPNPKTGAKGTVLAYDWLQELQEEQIAVVQAGGLTPTKGVKTQLRDAIAAMIAAGGGGGGGGGSISGGANVNTGGGVGVFEAVAGPTLQFRGVGAHADGSTAVAFDNGTKQIRVQAVAATGVQRGTIQLAGQLGGAATAPDVRGARETGGPTLLAYGAIADGQYVRRSGTTLVGDSSTVPDADAATKGKVQLAGQLGGTAALPDVRGARETGGPTLLAYGAIADGQYVRRSGTTLVGDSSTVPDADAATKGKLQLAGHLGGTAATPDVRGMRETGGPTLLTTGAVSDGSYLRRVGTTLVGDSAPIPDADAATKGKIQLAGQLGGSAASPDVRGLRETTGPTLLTIGAIADGQVLVRAGGAIIGSSGGGAGNVVGPGAGPAVGELAGYNGTNQIAGTGIVPVGGRIPSGKVRPQAWDYHSAQVWAWGSSVAYDGVPNPLSLNGAAWSEIRDVDGRWARATTGAVSGNAAGVLTPSYDWFEPRWNPDMVWRLRLPVVTSLRVWVGFFDLDPKASATHASQHIAGIRFDTGAADATFVCYSAGAAGIAETTVTAIAPTAALIALLRVELDYTSTPTVRFWIGDTLVATHTTRVPSSTALLGGGYSITTLTSSAKTIDLSRGEWRHK